MTRPAPGPLEWSPLTVEAYLAAEVAAVELEDARRASRESPAGELAQERVVRAAEALRVARERHSALAARDAARHAGVGQLELVGAGS
jgi:hypothetical protein